MTTKFEEATNYDELRPYVVSVTVPSPNQVAPFQIEGIINNNLSLAGSATWDTEDSTLEGGLVALRGLADDAKKWAVDKVSGITGGLGADAIQAGANTATSMAKIKGGIYYQGLSTTFKKYVTSSMGSFSIEFHVFPDKHGSYKEVTDKVFKLSQPRIELGEVGRSMTSYLFSNEDLMARWINADYFDNILIHLRIGNWFFAKGLYCNSSSINFSQFLDTDGKPVYATVNCTFDTHRAYSAEEISEWFLI